MRHADSRRIAARLHDTRIGARGGYPAEGSRVKMCGDPHGCPSKTRYLIPNCRMRGSPVCVWMRPNVLLLMFVDGLPQLKWLSRLNASSRSSSRPRSATSRDSARSAVQYPGPSTLLRSWLPYAPGAGRRTRPGSDSCSASWRRTVVEHLVDPLAADARAALIARGRHR